MENYQSTARLNVTADKIFNALTNGIPLWWSRKFEGSARQQADIFTVRFGDRIYKTMQVQELVHNSKVVWYVEDSLIAVPELQKQTEWIGTSIVWKIASDETVTHLHLTHIGLQPEVECYDICVSGWQQFTDSLRSFVETGKGNPFDNGG